MNAKRTGRSLKPGDRVRLISGGPTGKIVKAAAGGKVRVAWKLTYYSNHSPERLRLDREAAA